MNELQKANDFILRNKEKVKSTFRNQFHLMAPIGWINDPNGFIFFRGEYHLFYQFFPYDSVWGPMHWGHAKSKDLIHWEDLPVALAPSEAYDIDGCFSGTAIEKDDKLYLFYTGHVENSEIKRETQCFAVSEDGIHFEKFSQNPVVDESHIVGIAPPEDFRDPKVFERDGIFYMLVATKTADDRGQILLFESKDIKTWAFKSVFLEGDLQQGIMWECPDLFQLDNKDVLIMSPIQMPSVAFKYQNRSSTLAFIGSINWESGIFDVENYHEIDGGMDFYAPQTCEDDSGKRYLIAWMQMWNRNMPTNDLKHGWAGSMTLPRELYLENNCLKQKPVKFSDDLKELVTSISEKKLTSALKLEKLVLPQNYVHLEVDVLDSKKIQYFYGKNDTTYFEIEYDVSNELLTINREQMGCFIKGAEDPILNKRSIQLPLTNNVLSLDFYCDTSAIEIFTSDGQSMTSTFFEENFNGAIELKSDKTCLIKNLEVFNIILNK